MTRIGVFLLVTSVAALSASAQIVTGSGTAGTISEFKSSTTIGNSPIFDFNGNIGIGTTTARFPLDTHAGSFGPSPRTGPILVMGELRINTKFARKHWITFSPGKMLPAVGDFNQNGRLDLATPKYKDNTVSVLLQ
jgi:hypothetical protein